jgi:membrane fusion protein, multidrug efflux system
LDDRHDVADEPGRTPDENPASDGRVDWRERSPRDERQPSETPAPRREAPGDAERRDEAEGDDESGDKAPRKRQRWPLIALAVVIVIAAIAGTIYWYLTRNQESTDDAYTDGRAIMVAPHVAGYVVALAVNDNQFVHKGDLLAQIETRDYAAARDQASGQVTAAEAQVANARVALEKAQATYPAQLAQAQGQLAQARGQLFQAESEYRRQHTVNRAATSQQSVDLSTANLQQAQGQVQQAEAQVTQASLVSQDIEQARAQVIQLEGQLQQARAALAQAEINLGYTRIAAPQDGWVTKRNVELGNYLQPGAPILAIVVPEVWVTANFKETQLDRMRPGEKVRIAVDAYPRLKLTGHVDSIQLGSGTKFTAFPPENATGNFVKIVQRVPVKIVIDDGLDPTAPLPLGVSVVPTVTVK